ncbi:MAG: hypothetical protein QME51_05605, partial [Planctomycetota bacterium]|nr:hypothetical protein [Planctomycetota bacterium]
RNHKIQKENVYLILIAPKIANQTFIGMGQKSRQGFRVITLSIDDFNTIDELIREIISLGLSVPITHILIKELLTDIFLILQQADNLNDYNSFLCDYIFNWQKKVIDFGLNILVAIKAYQVIIQSRKGKVCLSEVMNNLLKLEDVKDYSKQITASMIENSLVSWELVHKIRPILGTDEPIFEPILHKDVKSRIDRMNLYLSVMSTN